MMDVLIDGVWFEVLEVDSYFVDSVGRRRAIVAASDGYGVVSVDVSLYTSRVHRVTD